MRQIRYEKTFDDAAAALGGYHRIDPALEPILDGLRRNPYGFPLIENDWLRVRYAVTRPIRRENEVIPALLVVFSIVSTGEVSLLHVEEYQAY